MVVKNLPSQRDFVLTNREEALIDQLALLAKVSCAAPRRATTTFSTVFVIILAVHHDAIAKGAVPSRLKIDLTNYTQKHSTETFINVIWKIKALCSKLVKCQAFRP